MVKLSKIISKKHIVDLISSKKDNVLKEIIYSLGDLKQITDINEVYKGVLEREKIMSTGIGNGIAIPHIMIPEVTDLFMVIGRKKGGLDFDSLDGKPVYLVLMICASDKQKDELLKILARVLLLFKNSDFRDQIVNARDSEEVYKLLKNR